MTKRDLQVLVQVYQHQVLSRDHLLHLGLFQSVSRLNRRLAMLAAQKYLTRHLPPLAAQGAAYLYTLGTAGVDLVSAHLELDPGDVRRHLHTERTPTFLQHTLAIADFGLNLRKAVDQTPQVTLERWLPEVLIREEYQAAPQGSSRFQTYVFKPDAFARLVFEDAYYPLFVEIDRGNVSEAKWQSKIRVIEHYRVSGLFPETYGQPTFAILIVTTTPTRLSHLLELVPDGPGILYLGTTFTALTANGALGPIWHRRKASRPLPLLEALAPLHAHLRRNP